MDTLYILTKINMHPQECKKLHAIVMKEMVLLYIYHDSQWLVGDTINILDGLKIDPRSNGNKFSSLRNNQIFKCRWDKSSQIKEW